MRILGRQFVMGRTIEEALERARDAERHGYRHSYDMLGEAARTAADAARYFAAYDACDRGDRRGAAGRRRSIEAPGISVKLSALHPRYEMAQRDRVLARTAAAPARARARTRAQAGIGFTIDAEEADRLELSLDLFEALALAPELAGWDGLGLAVQAYQKRAPAGRSTGSPISRGAAGRRLMVRLVKGAYWDSEIKRAQERGLDGYPGLHAQGRDRRLLSRLRQRGCSTRGARLLSAIRDAQRAYRRGGPRTWPADAAIASSSACTAWARRSTTQIVGPDELDRPCRVYAPVGSHEDLLPYLVRRLLENGANTSLRQPHRRRARSRSTRSSPTRSRGSRSCRPSRIPRIPLPRDLLRAGAAEFARARSERSDERCGDLRDELAASAAAAVARRRRSSAASSSRGDRASRCSTRPTAARQVGEVVDADAGDVDRALARAVTRAPRWDAHAGGERAPRCCERAADLYESARAAADGADRPRRRPTIPTALVRGARGGRFPALLRGARARRFRRAERAARPDRRAQRARAARPRRLRLHLAVEFPAGDLHRPDRRGARRRQRGHRQARRADAADRRRRGAAAARGRHPGRCAASAAGRPARRSARALVADPRIAGVAFTGSTETARAINLALARARRADRAVHRRDRRAERDDRRFLGAAPSRSSPTCWPRPSTAPGSAARRCACSIVQDDIADRLHGDAGRRDGGAGDRRSGAARDRCRPGHRRRGARGAGASTPRGWSAKAG